MTNQTPVSLILFLMITPPVLFLKRWWRRSDRRDPGGMAFAVPGIITGLEIGRELGFLASVSAFCWAD